MKAIKILSMLSLVLVSMGFASCHQNRSYAELLNDERHACNAFLSNFELREVPADTVFEVGEKAPFYRLDDAGNVYMQVLKAGDRKNNQATKSQRIYFRYTRYNLLTWYEEDNYWVPSGSNADDMSSSTSYFLYNDYSLDVSTQWGYAMQMPLKYLGIDCEVNLVVKSQYGWSSEISAVQPYYYHLRYFPSKI